MLNGGRAGLSVSRTGTNKQDLVGRDRLVTSDRLGKDRQASLDGVNRDGLAIRDRLGRKRQTAWDWLNRDRLATKDRMGRN